MFYEFCILFWRLEYYAVAVLAAIRLERRVTVGSAGGPNTGWGVEQVLQMIPHAVARHTGREQPLQGATVGEGVGSVEA